MTKREAERALSEANRLERAGTPCIENLSQLHVYHPRGGMCCRCGLFAPREWIQRLRAALRRSRRIAMGEAA